jgi:hypothetical protein
MNDALDATGERGGEQSVRHRPALDRADADIDVSVRLVGWVTWFSVMSCRTRMAHVAVDGAAAVRAPALRRHSPGRHRVRGRSAGGSDRGNSPVLADLASEPRASTAQRQLVGAVAVREEADMADAMEPVRHGVQ